MSVTVDVVPATCVTAGIGHSMDGTADCENGASCTLCDYEQPALGHKWELDSDVQTTCTVGAHQILSYEMIMHEEDHPTTRTQIVDLTKLVKHIFAVCIIGRILRRHIWHRLQYGLYTFDCRK